MSCGVRMRFRSARSAGPGSRDCRFRTGLADSLGQPKIDNFGRETVVALQAHHDVSRLDIPVDEFLFVNGLQPGSYLRDNFQGWVDLQPPGASARSTNCPDEFAGEVKATACGCRITDTVRNPSRSSATTARDTPGLVKVARIPWIGGMSAMSAMRTRFISLK
jgi:hypothetical protein